MTFSLLFLFFFFSEGRRFGNAVMVVNEIENKINASEEINDTSLTPAKKRSKMLP